VAFSMQDTLGNVLGGIALELDSSLALGDWIKVDDVVGRVVDIRWRSTSIETRNWETVVVPNSYLMKTRFAVLGKRKNAPLQWRRWIWFDIDCSVSPMQVADVVGSALNQAEITGVAAQPAPDCLLMGFESGDARYAVRYWLTDLARDDPTDSSVRTHVFVALQRAGIRVAAPEQSVHLTTEDERHRQMLQERELTRRLAAIQHVDLFAGFSAEELRTVAERLVFAPFAKGDVMTRQGAVAHWLYILTKGEAEVVLEQGDGSRRVLTTLSAGTFFGEMGLMTGSARTATVIAHSDAECYRLDKASFADLLHARPSMADEISRILATRQVDLGRIRQDLDAERHARDMARHSGEILARIKQFFGLVNE
jgi:CRP-like cAMP-binding protein